MAVFNKFHCYVVDLGLQVHNLNKDPLSVYLTNSQPRAEHSRKADVEEIRKGNGYKGPVNVDSTYSGSNGTGALTVEGHQFEASGGKIGPFRYVVLCNPSAAGTPLIAWWDYGSEITLDDGERFRFAPGSPIWTVT
jgi:hypothetical protein